jgi:hypothetical protein
MSGLIVHILLTKTNKGLTMKMQKLLVASAIAGLMAACAPGPQATTGQNDGFGTDTDATEQTDGTGMGTGTDTGAGTGTDTGTGMGTGTDTDTDTGMGTDGQATDQDAAGTGMAGSVPQDVMNSFQERFPGATPNQWVPTDYGYYATFNQDGDQYIANFSALGEWISTNQEVQKSDLPEPVQEAYDNAPARENVTDERFLKVNTPQFEEIYIIQGQAGGSAFTHYYMPDGRELQAGGGN